MENKALNRPHKKIDPEKLRAYVEEHPDAYQREMAEEFDCSVAAIQKSIETPRNYMKRKTTLYKEQDSEKIKTYQEQIKGIPPENIAYIDETGIDTYLFREHGYAPKG